MSPPSTDNSFLPSSPVHRQSSIEASSPQRPSFYSRFGRRPRTSSNANSASFAASTSNLLAPSPGRGTSFSDLLRSSSSSQVHLPASAATEASPSRPSRISLQSRVTSPSLDRTAQMASPNPSTPQGGSGSALGRMFRRYSQGQGGGSSRVEPQRSSTRDRERESINLPRTSTATDRETGSSPMRSSTIPPATSPGLPRSSSYGASLTSPLSHDGSSAIPASRTLNTIRAEPAADAAPVSSPSPPIAPTTAIPTHPMAASEPVNTAAQADQTVAIAESAPTDTTNGTPAGSSTPTASRPLNGMHRIRLVPHLEATRSLHFEPIERDLKEGAGAVKVGRFTDRQPLQQRDPLAATLAGAPGTPNETQPQANEFGSAIPATQSTRGQPGARGGAIPISGSAGGGGRIDSSRIAFKSKVVSRGHAEIWCEPGGKFFLRDTKSSSGTFLNHIRLSAPNTESRPFAIKDGDVVQLGVDYQGGTEEIYRCVKMRVELNRGWQREANQFNVNALRQLRALQGTPLSPPEEKGKTGAASAALPTNRQGVSVTDCCICLFSVTVCQALFIAPCSHVFHYKCIRPLLNLHHPGFSCPLCRTFADLDADVEEDEAWQEALMQEARAAEARFALGKQPLEVGTPAVELDAPITAALLPTLMGTNANGSGREEGSTASLGAVAARLPATSAASPLLADVQATHGSATSALGRGTAALSKRKNDWARPDTAVGSSAGPLGGDETFAVGGSGDQGVSRISAEMGEMAVADRLLNEDVTGHTDSAAQILYRSGSGANHGGSPVRRSPGSGPIAIGSGGSPHQHRSTSSNLAGPPAMGSLEEGWPAGAMGGFSPGLEEAGTPLNHTFLSTLAEAPQAASSSPSSARDFPPGRSAPAHQTLVPATMNSVGTSHRSQLTNDADGRRKRSSDGGEDVDTAEEEVGAASSGAANGESQTKGKARVHNDVFHDALSGEESDKPSPSGRSHIRKEASVSDSDGDHPPPPRTGPNLNASAYMSHQLHQANQGGGGRGETCGEDGSSPTSESKMARFKRRISHGISGE